MNFMSGLGHNDDPTLMTAAFEVNEDAEDKRPRPSVTMVQTFR